MRLATVRLQDAEKDARDPKVFLTRGQVVTTLGRARR
jgi:hypothetical protein